MHNDPWKLASSEIIVAPIYAYIHEEWQLTWIGIHRDRIKIIVFNKNAQ